MENTNCGDNCPFVKCGFCDSDKNCPNYVESWWIDGQTQQQKLIRDCAPKRMMLQNAMQQTKIESLQAAMEQMRNEASQINSHLQAIASLGRKTLENQTITQYRADTAQICCDKID